MKTLDYTPKCPPDKDSLGIPVFKVKERIYTWKDVLSFAEFQGIFNDHWQALKDGIIATMLSEQENYCIPSSEMQEAANSLRYDFNLITAQETEEWLQKYEISLDDLNEFLNRKLLRKHFKNQLRDLPSQYLLSKNEIVHSLWPELIFNNSYPNVVMYFARRVVIREFKSHLIINLDEEIEKEKRKFCDREGIEFTDNLQDLVKNPFLKDSFSVNLSLRSSTTVCWKCCCPTLFVANRRNFAYRK